MTDIQANRRHIFPVNRRDGVDCTGPSGPRVHSFIALESETRSSTEDFREDVSRMLVTAFICQRCLIVVDRQGHVLGDPTADLSRARSAQEVS